MKLKGIKPIEQHVEKIFLAVMVATLLAVLALQFVGGGNTIKVGSEDGVPIDRAHSRVADQAQRQLARIRDVSPATEADVPTPDYVSAFLGALDEPVYQSVRLHPFGPREGADGVVSSFGEAQALLVPEPRLPRPSRPVVHTQGGTVDPLLVAQLPQIRDIAEHLPSEQPFDLQAVTVEATFDAAALVASLRADPRSGSEMQRIPELWWSSVLEIIDIELYRQEVYPDGAFGPEELLPPIPGQLSLRDRLQDLDSQSDLRAISQAAREHGRSILRPRFLNMIAGEPWIPPTDALAATRQVGEVDRLRRDFQSVSREIENVRRQLTELGRQSMGAPQTGAEGARAQITGPGGGGGAAPPGARRPTTGTSGVNQRSEGLRRKLEDLQSRRDSIATALRAQGVDPAGVLLADPAREALRAPAGRLRDSGSVRIWAHDISARPGAVYRYQIRVVTPNPLFGHDAALAEEIRDLAARSTLRSDASPWSDTVAVDEDSYLFITGASLGGGIGRGAQPPTVTAEIFRFFNGYWRSDKVSLEPGDAVTGALRLEQLDLPFFVIDDGEGAPRVTEHMRLEGTLPFHVAGWYLVDVTEFAARGRREELQAVLRDPTGELVVRQPERDRLSERLVRLRRSAETGLSAVVRTPVGLPEGDDARGGPGQPGRTTPSRDSRPDGGRMPGIGG